MTTPADRCPACAQPNECGVAAGRSACWCFELPARSRVPATGKIAASTAACYCARCLDFIKMKQADPQTLAMVDRPLNVLFLSTGNSARSLIAESLLTHRAAGRFKAYSAGSFPRGQTDTHAIDLLRRTRLPTLDLRSKSWDEFARPGAPEMDFIFTLCDDAHEQVCPVWPGQPVTAHWGVPDPAAAQGSELDVTDAYREALRILERRIELFTLLPLQSLDRISLTHHMGEIAQSR